MSIGVIMGRKPIAGSCGGIKAMGEGAVCEICGGDPNRCDSEQDDSTDAKPKEESEFYDALQTSTKTK